MHLLRVCVLGVMLLLWSDGSAAAAPEPNASTDSILLEAFPATTVLTTQTENLRLQYMPQNAAWANAVIQQIDAGRRDLQNRLRRSFLVPIEVVLVPNQGAYNKLAGPGIEHSLACAVPSKRRILINCEELAKQPPSEFSNTVLHELTHLFLGVLCAKSPPRWLDEGIAQAVSDPWSVEDESQLSRALWLGHLPRLSDLSVSFPAEQGQRRIAYLLSRSVVDYRTQTDHGGSLAAFVATILGEEGAAELQSYHNAVIASALEHRWASQRWSWGGFGLLLLDGPLLMGVAFALLVTAYIVVQRRRNRLRMAEPEGAVERQSLDSLMDESLVPVIAISDRGTLETLLLIDGGWPLDADIWPLADLDADSRTYSSGRS